MTETDPKMTREEAEAFGPRAPLGGMLGRALIGVLPKVYPGAVLVTPSLLESIRPDITPLESEAGGQVTLFGIPLYVWHGADTIKAVIAFETTPDDRANLDDFGLT